MSAAAEGDRVQCCASCGTTGGDDINLKRCNGCFLVRYCSVKCQKEHRPKHKKACKKRAAELRDELLFRQPESNHHGDCPICCVPLPIDNKKSTLYSCCSKQICNGCQHANRKREIEGRLQQRCPFCRKAAAKTDEESYVHRQRMKRIEANDPVAMREMGKDKSHEGDYNTAFEYFTKAAALGDIEAHYQLSGLYQEGEGVEKDQIKQIHHLTKASIGGHPKARHNLGWLEARRNGRLDRAVKHFTIAAKLGDDKSLENLKELYKAGYVSKEDFAAALRGHHAAIVATKSPQREEAYELLGI